MDKRTFPRLAVLIALALAFSALLPVGHALSKDDRPGSRGKGKKAGHVEGQPAGWQKGKKEGWRTEFPPGWKNWDDAKRQRWELGLGRAKKAVRKHAEDRLNAALRALEVAARKGTPLDHAERMAKAGLERGLGPFDFEPLGKFVVERVKEGVKGEELSRTIHEEISRRRQERQRLREEMKEKIKQSQEGRKRQRKEMKEKRELGKRLKEKSVKKEGEEQENDEESHGRPRPRGGRGKGKKR